MKAKQLLFAGVAAMALQPALAQAGGLAPAVPEQVIVVEDAGPRSSAREVLIPALALLFFVALASKRSSSGGGGGDPGCTYRCIGESDRRIKRDIVWTGMKNGFAIYRYRYGNTPQVFEGVMAQEVALQRPDAVIREPRGIMRVNYAKLGLELRQVA